MSAIGTAPRYFHALDGFRGILAVCVAIYHTFWLSNTNSQPFFDNGPVLIDLFFVFSGFLMATLYGERLRHDPAEAARFLRRRFARLYPVHFVMTLVFLAFAGARIWADSIGLSTSQDGEILPFRPGASEGVWSLIANLTLTQSMGTLDSLSFNAPAWTISVEVFTYFVFVLIWLRHPPRTTWHYAAIGSVAVACYALLFAVKPDMNITHDLGFFRCLGGFFTGLVGAEIFRRAQGWTERLPAKAFTLAEIAAALGFALFVIYLPGKGQFLVGPFALVFVLVFACDGGSISRLLSTRPFAWLARISYSLYMCHAIFAVVFGIGMGLLTSQMGETFNASGWIGDAVLIPYLIACLIGAQLLHGLVEVPGRRWINGWRRSSKADGALAGARGEV